jgi:hypothetical protein
MYKAKVGLLYLPCFQVGYDHPAELVEDLDWKGWLVALLAGLDKVHTINVSHLHIKKCDNIVVIRMHKVRGDVSFQPLDIAFLLVLIQGFCE